MRLISTASRNLTLELAAFSHAVASRPAPTYRWDVFELRRKAYRILAHLLEEHHSPRQIGWAVFFGVLIGTTPFFGFHLAICILVAMLLRLNKLLVYAAANISIPIIAPFLAFASYQVGHFIFQHSFAPVTMGAIEVFKLQSLTYWIVGSIVFGSVLGAVLGYASFLMSKTLTKEPHPFLVATRKLSHSFVPGGRFAAGLAKGKTRRDPIYKRLLEQIPGGAVILDLGGGRGYLSILHNLYHATATSHQVWDWDERKLQQGEQSARHLQLESITFKKSDIFSETTFPPCSVVCLIDVLHYQPIPVQDTLLRRIFATLPAGGHLYIRDIDAALGWRTKVTLLQETFSLKAGLTRAVGLHPRPGTELVSFLTSLGFNVKLEPCSEGTPFANVLIKAIKSPE